MLLQINVDSGEENTVLDVPVARRDDTGKYTIALKNEYGEDEGDINVIVLGQCHINVIVLGQCVVSVVIQGQHAANE